MPGAGLLVYDGDCGFCTRAAAWVAAGWAEGGPTIAAFQSLGPDGLAARGLTVAEAAAAVQWVGPDGRIESGHRAVAAALAAGSGWRRAAGRVLGVPPVRWAAASVYPLVARFRHRLPGATAACRTGAADIPGPPAGA